MSSALVPGHLAPLEDPEKASRTSVSIFRDIKSDLDSDSKSKSDIICTSGSGSSSASTSEDVKEETPLPSLPDKHGTRVTRYLHHNFFTVYRKMFSAIFIVNLTAFIIFVAQSKGAPTLSNVKNATSANVLVCILMRQEETVNLVYEIFTCVPHWVPLVIRKKLAKVYHYGGVHSGCGVAAVVWFLLYTVLASIQFFQNPKAGLPVANVITCYLLVMMFLFILGGAYPKFRVRFHDYFEAVHRFAGWTALCILWTQTFIIAGIKHHETGASYGLTIIRAPSFWLLLASTCCTFLSWSRLRLREVIPETLSDHATRLHFKYKNMPPFYGLKISDRPLLEWHAFATIPDDDGEGFSVVVSNAGDWTKKQIQNPPKKLWTRGYPLHGLLYTSRLFRQIVLVATGSGIGPCLSLMFCNVTPRRILWSTRNPEVTYGPRIVETVKKSDPNAVIWNTRERGYPDIVAETYKLYVESGAEAVFIISNPKVTRKVVYGMETRGIAAYGAIFDS
ncbi:hypothetical protein K432DRAFT_304715 [Lepidopterella palustris CBS 459.81]|uniref:Non-ribosomal peptide synthetase n=1 Tax=Lepidopterella palustris CBS 459.81 TaxID=1314670 RepID=A0A8E2JCD3_9PEZI|nr:hypothetical protein K432DRAFT_304715 [Lepidopterella palustris CBS 459.81]